MDTAFNSTCLNAKVPWSKAPWVQGVDLWIGVQISNALDVYHHKATGRRNEGEVAEGLWSQPPVLVLYKPRV